MKKITKFEEFITESKLQLLLEANIKFSDEFIDLLNKIESPLVKKILDLENNEVDVNRNYMTYDIEKEDSVLFYPDDKVEKQDYKTTLSSYSFMNLSYTAEKENLYSIKNVARPESNQNVKIIKELTQEEIDLILPGITNKVVHISFTDENNFTGECFYPKNYLVRDLSKLKTSDTKVGRFFNNFLNKANIGFTLVELDDFINKYKTELKEIKEKFTRFEIVTGKDIAYWYSKQRYEKEGSGSLGSSCMRYDKCKDYFSIYTDNDNVSMVILKSKTYKDKITGRAILWDAELINTDDDVDSTIKFMDKIYVNDYSDEAFFIKFARENNFYYKQNQNSSETPIMFNGELLSEDNSLMTVSIQGGDYSYYPYIDTLKYYDDSGILTNSDSEIYDYTLTDTDGGDGSCSSCGGRGDLECESCDGDGEVSCDDCYSGTNTCGDCYGDGKTDCNNCDGQGNLECNSCSGEGKVDCDECDGTGEDGDEECSYCDGSGKKDCDDCDGEGNKDCRDCDGEGDIECEECGGDGDIECSTCYGNGQVDCNRCDNSGRHECYQCN